MDNTAVTIVVTCYNKEDFIEKAVLSALRQEFSLPYEVIVVDDCSTDNSRHVIESIMAEAPLLQAVFNKTNVNVATCRNTGFEMGRGRYCVSLDGDDWIEPDYLEAVYDTINADPTIGIVYPGKEYFGEDHLGNQYSVETAPVEWDRDLLLHFNYIPSCGMFRKKAWEEAGKYPNLGGWEDYGLWLKIIAQGYRGVAVQGIFFHYLQVLESRAFRSALAGKKLTSLLREICPHYIGPTGDELEATRLYLDERQREIDYCKMAKETPELLQERFPEVYRKAHENK